MSAAARELFVGIDVGGTNVAGALADGSGEILQREKERTPRRGGPDELLEVIAGIVEKLLSGAPGGAGSVTAVGLGVPGLVDPDEGTVIVAPNVGRGLNGVQLVDPLEQRLGLPVFLGNDVNVGIMGEAWLGAARGLGHVVGIFVGTGIGGGIVSDGRLLVGANSAAGEVGHMIMQVDGPSCGCGNRGCLEALASRTAIERDLRAAMAAGRETMLADMLEESSGAIRSKVLRKCLRKNDPVVTEVMERAGRVIGLACISIQHLLQPEAIVLGGGVVEACGEFLMPVIEKTFDADPLKVPGARGRVVASALGDDAGVLGAAALAREGAENGNGNGHDHGDGDGDDSSRSAADLPKYPSVECPEPGRATVGDREYSTDLYVRSDGKVKKRKRALIKKKYGTSHVVGRDELKKVCKGRPEVLFVGTGHRSSVKLDESAQTYISEKGIACRLLPSPEAAREYSAAGGRKALLLHVKG